MYHMYQKNKELETRRRKLRVCQLHNFVRWILAGLLTLSLAPLLLAQEQEPTPSAASLEQAFPARPYSPYAARDFPTRVSWGDTHLHTSFSMDAGAFGARLGPQDAYRFAAGRRSWPPPASG